MERIKKIKELAKEYGFSTKITEKEKVTEITVRAKNTDGKRVNWFNFTKFGDNSSFIRIYGNTDNLNIWLCQTTSLSANDIYDFFDKFNEIIGHCEKAPVKKFVDPEDWQEIAGIEDADTDARYAGKGRKVALAEDNMNCVDELIVDTDENTISATYETWFDVEEYFGCEELREEEWLTFYTWYHTDTDKVTAKYIIDTPDGSYENDWHLTKQEEEFFKDCMEAHSIISEGKGLVELFKEVRAEEMCTWRIGVYDSNIESLDFYDFYGTREDIKAQLQQMLLADKSANNAEDGNLEAEEISEGTFSAYACHGNKRYFAIDAAKVKVLRKECLL